jgi:hypothetical protein
MERKTFSENQELAAKMGELAAQSCEELFAAYGVQLASGATMSADSDERLYCGVVGFVGSEVRGTCLLLGNEQPMRDSQPAPGSLQDWVGELANQLVGRLKGKLLTRGLEIALTTPIVISGVRVQPLPKSLLRPTLFSAPGGRIGVWLETESALQIVLDMLAPAESAEEGNILLF